MCIRDSAALKALAARCKHLELLCHSAVVPSVPPERPSDLSDLGPAERAEDAAAVPLTAWRTCSGPPRRSS
eukprot:14810306-Alexandrium_andersonii.AAC.1